MNKALDRGNAAQTNTDPRILHAKTLKSSYTDRSDFNNLITLYSKSNLLSYSVRVFHQIPSPNIVSWTSLISSHSNSHLSLRFFLSMLCHPTVSFLPNQRTFASLFKTCASLSYAFSFGLSLHSMSLKLSFNDKPFCGSALLNFYSKFRLPDNAKKVFDEMLDKEEVCYSAMIVCLAQNSRCVDSLSVFADMRRRDVVSTVHSVSGALRSAAELAAMEQCRIIHGHALVAGFDRNVVVGTALIDAYGKAGHVFDARRVFDENVSVLNVVAWNAMLSGYAQQGDKNSVLELFHLLETRGFSPDEYSFLAVLMAFSNVGLASESEKWIEKMRVHYGLEPGLEHYTCLIGAFGRAGRLVDAEKIAMEMPFEPDAAVWRALLSSSALHGAPDMALRMAHRLLEVNRYDDSAYVIAANVLSASGRWDEVADMRKMMKDRRVRKEGGRSWIEVKGEVHVFLAGDRNHYRAEEIYTKLEELIEECEKLGYVPIWNEMLHKVEEREKTRALWYHSEKLALAFGLVSGTPPGKALRIVKNLRICRDCHESFKYISRVVEREIIVRDVNRYHRILNGSCTCGDIW
ncbi:hypothetical protein LWI28_002889 [Acer negundo]|uniref:DYW domain-containing protein n=1 Tax=Acer negundo TaxID=4023 RepID=A0AAD5JC82_ACENE|nr:hypothetical protein LWI28_002889 [Acer negundo]